MARILHLISHLEQGGTQRQLSYVVSRNQTHELEIASLIRSPMENLFPAFRESRLPIHFLSDSSDFYAPEILPKLKTLVHEREYSLIHCWLFQPIVQGLLAARSSGIPCVSSPRSMRETLRFDSAKLWERILIRRSLWNSDLILFPSYSVAVDFIDSGWSKLERARIIQNGVDTDYFFPSTTGGGAVISVGRNTPEKGFEDFEWIAGNLKKEFPDFPFLVAGGAKKTGTVLDYVGHLDDIRPVLGTASIFVSTSRSEGMSNAILEAQAMGIPVVARRLGSTSEIIKDGTTGILADSREDLLTACRGLLKNPDRRSEMGKKARENIVSHFTIGQQTKQIEALYSELL